MTDKVEDCCCPDAVTKKTGSEIVCLGTVYMTEEVSVAVVDAGPLRTTCLLPITGGSGGGTVHNCEEPEETRVCGSDSLLIKESSTDELSTGRKEHETEAACDKNDNRTTARLTENPDVTGTYIGDLTIAVLV